MKGLLLAMALVFFLSCAPEPSVVWVVEDSWILPSAAAASDWLSGKGEDVAPGRAPNTRIRFDEDLTYTALATQWLVDVGGNTRNTIEVGPQFEIFGEKKRAVVMAHEMMHLLGYGHSGNCGELMHPYPSCQPEELR